MIALGGALQAQTVFTSGFETWQGNTPDGWVGAKTSISTDSIFQSTTAHSGTYAVELHNTTPHKRFTTVQQTVVSGTSYTISTFGVMMALGFLVGFWITAWRMRELGMEAEAAPNILVWMMVGGTAFAAAGLAGLLFGSKAG